MKIFFDHITGKLTHHDIVYSLALAEFNISEYDYALDNGWIPLSWYYTKMKKLTWLNARTTRLLLNKFSFSKKQKYKLRSDVTYKVVDQVDDKVKQEQADIYKKYIRHKNYHEINHEAESEDFFIFRDDPIDWKTFLYYHDEKLVAFTEFFTHNKQILTGQFAWNDENDKLGVGTFATLSEIKWAIDNNYEKYYLSYGYENSSIYKSKFDGFEFWTGREWCSDINLFKELCKNDSEIKTLTDLNEYQEKYFDLILGGHSRQWVV